MSALTSARIVLVKQGAQKRLSLPLKAGTKAWTNGVCCLDTAAAGFVLPAVVSTTVVPIGWFAQDVDATAATLLVGVDLQHEKNLWYFDSVTGGGAVTSANLLQKVYLASDHEVTTVSTGASLAGVVWAVTPYGIGVEFPWALTL